MIGVQVRRGKVVIELEDRALEVDFERNALVPVKRRAASKRR